MVSPCRTCAHAGRSKNHPDCVHCRERQLAWDGYVRMEAPVEKTEGGAKVCTDPKCPHEGKPQPVENFRKNHKAPDGRLNTCNACMRRKLSEGQKKRQAKKQADADVAKCESAGDGAAKEFKYPQGVVDLNQYATGVSIMVDFKDNADLLERFMQKAADQLRTPENMLLYLAKRFVECKPMEWV